MTICFIKRKNVIVYGNQPINRITIKVYIDHYVLCTYGIYTRINTIEGLLIFFFMLSTYFFVERKRKSYKYRYLGPYMAVRDH